MLVHQTSHQDSIANTKFIIDEELFFVQIILGHGRTAKTGMGLFQSSKALVSQIMYVNENYQETTHLPKNADFTGGYVVTSL